MSRQRPERETRIPGLARLSRVPKRAGPAGGNEAMSRTPMAERTLRSSHIAAPLKGAAQIYFVIRFAAGIMIPCGSTDAGGEDVGYFATNGKSGFDSRL